jgi:3',5'-cyclic-AMP phosphodiesterase
MAFKIAQISDIHCGEIRFSESNLKYFISTTNKEEPDLVVVAGDLTANGFLDEFTMAKKYIDQIKCKEKMIIAGNHDARNVGYEHYETIFGPRYEERVFLTDDSEIAVMSVDSNRPDDDDGEVGRDKYKYLDSFFSLKRGFKILVLHHHLVSIPGTGRERNVVRDAGDLLEKIKDLNINLVLSGHKHVPYVWNLNDVNLVTSGTAGTLRTRGTILPAINIIEIEDNKSKVRILSSDKRERCINCEVLK